MKKGYYLIIALSMAILTIVYSPIKSYAAGATVQGSYNFNSRFRAYAQTNAVAELTNLIPADTDHDITSEHATFEFTVNTRSESRPVSGDNTQRYLNGFVMYNVVVNLSMNSTVTDWGYSYSVDYPDMRDGVTFYVYASSVSSNNITFNVFVCYDNVFYNSTMYDKLSDININVSLNTVKPSSTFVPYVTINTVSVTSSEGNASLNPTDTPALSGERFSLESAIEYALVHSTAISEIIDLLSYIYTNFPNQFTQMISRLTTISDNSSIIVSRLVDIYNTNKTFYNWLQEYIISVGQTEASEMASERASAEQEMQELESQLQVSTPAIGSELGQLESFVAQADTTTPFFWLTGSNIVVTILIVTLLFGLVGYVLHGNE